MIDPNRADLFVSEGWTGTGINGGGGGGGGELVLNASTGGGGGGGGGGPVGGGETLATCISSTNPRNK